MDDTKAALQMADHLLQISGLPNEEITTEHLEAFENVLEEFHPSPDKELLVQLVSQFYLAGLLLGRQSEDRGDIPITLTSEGAVEFVKGLFTEGITLRITVE